MQENPKTIVIIIISVIIVATIGYFVWQSIGPAGTSPLSEWKTYLGFQTPIPPPTTPAAPATSEIVWQPYNNAKYDYSFKHPKNWYLDAANAEKDFAGDLGGIAILSNKQKPLELLMSANPPADLITLTFTVYKIDAETTVAQFIKDKQYATALSQANVVYGNSAGKQLLYVITNRDKKEVVNIITILKKNDRIYVFSYNSFKPDKDKLPKEVETIHDEIVKSLEVK